MGYKTLKTKVTGFFNPIKQAVVGVASDALSYPARASAQASIDKSNQLVKDIKLVRKTKGKVMNGADYTDPVFRARANVADAQAVRDQAQKKAAKAMLK